MGRYFNWLAMTSVNLSAQPAPGQSSKTQGVLQSPSVQLYDNHVQPTALLHL